MRLNSKSIFSTSIQFELEVYFYHYEMKRNKHQEQQELLQSVKSADRLLHSLGALHEYVTDPEIDDKAGQEHQVPRLQDIHLLIDLVAVQRHACSSRGIIGGESGRGDRYCRRSNGI